MNPGVYNVLAVYGQEQMSMNNTVEVASPTLFSTGHNYVTEITPREAVKYTYEIEPSNSSYNVSYYDGLGRGVQSVLSGLLPQERT